MRTEARPFIGGSAGPAEGGPRPSDPGRLRPGPDRRQDPERTTVAVRSVDPGDRAIHHAGDRPLERRPDRFTPSLPLGVPAETVEHLDPDVPLAQDACV